LRAQGSKDPEIRLKRNSDFLALQKTCLPIALGEQVFLLSRFCAPREQLGEQFKLKDFHDLVLRDGVLPLKVPEAQLHQWITSQKSARKR